MADYHQSFRSVTCLGLFALTSSMTTVAWSDNRPGPIADAELKAITASLVERFPKLASSPGVKASHVIERNDRVGGSVYFYPHNERAGVKEAYRAMCEKAVSDDVWNCDHVDIRRYLQIEGQAYEVRLFHDMSPQDAVAIIKAARLSMQENLPAHLAAPSTALTVSSVSGNTAQVSFGAPDGRAAVRLEARLSPGGDASSSDAWSATILSTPEDFRPGALVGQSGSKSSAALVVATSYFEEGTFAGYRINPGSDKTRFESLGLKPGDLLTKMDGEAIPKHLVVVARRFEQLRTGESVDVVVERGPDHRELEFRLRMSEPF